MLTGDRNVGDSLQGWSDGESEKGFGCVVKIDGIAVLGGLELKRKKKKEKEKEKRKDKERKRKKIRKDKRREQGRNGERGRRRTSLESTIV